MIQGVENTSQIQSNTNFYYEKCKTKCNYHHSQALKASQMDKLFSTFSMIVSSSQALTMTVMLVYEATTVEITVAGAIFAFIGGLANKLKDSFNFKAMSYQHHNVSDGYEVLYYEIAKVMMQEISREDFNIIVEKFVAIEGKSHLPNTRGLGMFCCFHNTVDII